MTELLWKYQECEKHEYLANQAGYVQPVCGSKGAIEVFEWYMLVLLLELRVAEEPTIRIDPVLVLAW